MAHTLYTASVMAAAVVPVFPTFTASHSWRGLGVGEVVVGVGLLTPLDTCLNRNPVLNS